jgi:hypothetical protein
MLCTTPRLSSAMFQIVAPLYTYNELVRHRRLERFCQIMRIVCDTALSGPEVLERFAHASTVSMTSRTVGSASAV